MFNTNKKSPWLAAFLSFILPGAGQVYAGQKDRGLVIMGATIVIYYLYANFALSLRQAQGSIWQWIVEGWWQPDFVHAGDFIGIGLMMVVAWLIVVHDAYKAV